MEEEIKASSTVNTPPNSALVDLFRRMPKLARQHHGWYSDFGDALRGGALGMAIVCGADLATIQLLYEVNPKELTKKNFWIACRCGAQDLPTIRYLYEKLQDPNEELEPKENFVEACRCGVVLPIVQYLYEKFQDPNEELELEENFFEICRCGAALPVIQYLYEKLENPDELLTTDNFLTLCKKGERLCSRPRSKQTSRSICTAPGVLPFLGEKQPSIITAECLCELALGEYNFEMSDLLALGRLQPKALFTKHDSDSWSCDLIDRDSWSCHLITIALKSTHRFKESDIQTLVELWPECLMETMFFGRYQGDATPLQYCLFPEFGYRGDRKKLLEFMIQHLPDTIEHFVIQIGGHTDITIGAEDLLWMEPVFQRCSGQVEVGGDRVRNCERHGLRNLLVLCFLQNRGIKDLSIHIPSIVWSEDSTSRADDTDYAALCMEEFQKKFALQQSHPNIEKLTMKFGNPVFCQLLGCLPKWPNLQHLVLDLGDPLDPSLDAFVPSLDALCELLRHGKLRILCIDLEAHPSSSKSRKRKGGSGKQEVQWPLEPLFHSLATSSTITSFAISQVEDIKDNFVLLQKALKKSKLNLTASMKKRKCPHTDIMYAGVLQAKKLAT